MLDECPVVKQVFDQTVGVIRFPSLVNVRHPKPISGEFLTLQDIFLQKDTRSVTDWCDLTPREEGTYLWQGDITTRKVDAIVNAANSGLTGCYYPCHKCIDNAIHTYAVSGCAMSALSSS